MLRNFFLILIIIVLIWFSLLWDPWLFLALAILVFACWLLLIVLSAVLTKVGGYRNFNYATIKRSVSWIVQLVLILSSGVCLPFAQDDSTEQSTTPCSLPGVINNTTRLTIEEIDRMSPMIAAEWNSLAGLMDIPYYKQEEIRFNHTEYRRLSSKAEQIFKLFNASEFFSRAALKNFYKELGRHDVECEMLPTENEMSSANTSQNETNMNNHETPLSPREICRFSRRISVDWYTLGGLMDIREERRDNIASNNNYYDDCARAEKVLSIVTNKEGFSRQVLAQCFKEMQKFELIKPVEDGLWRV